MPNPDLFVDLCAWNNLTLPAAPAVAAAGPISAPVLRLQAEKKVFSRQAVADISPADAAARLVCLSEEGQVGPTVMLLFTGPEVQADFTSRVLGCEASRVEARDGIDPAREARSKAAPKKRQARSK
jgi:hypothetical protein